jgi:GTPase SAR1 family protein
MGGHVSIRTEYDLHRAVTVVGLDGSGKSEIVFKMLADLSDSIPFPYLPIPTAGVAYSEFTEGKLTFGIYDCGGMARYRVQWPHFVKQSDGVVFVIDRTDAARIVRVREEIGDIITLCASLEKPLLVLVNKSDLNAEMRIPDPPIVNKLLDARLDYTVKECAAKTGDGIADARNWLVNQIQEKSRAKSVRST